ncbi:MAG: ExbD/TolR family protein [Planctomycetota bacterium]|jgi:biopolymer transport protein ExbD
MNLADAMPHRRARVEIIPLIDCVFIILVFFIYSMLAMTIRRGIVVQLPEARTIQASDDTAIVLTITAAGELMINDDAAGIAEFDAMLDAALAGIDQPSVVVNADAGSEHRWFVSVMDALTIRGINEVIVLTDTPPEGTAP